MPNGHDDEIKMMKAKAKGYTPYYSEPVPPEQPSIEEIRHELASRGELGGKAFVETLPPSMAGVDYVDYQGHKYPISELAAFIDTPKGKEWVASGKMGTAKEVGFLQTGETAVQYVMGDWTPLGDFLRAEFGYPPRGAGIDSGRAPTYSGYGQPTTTYSEAAPYSYYPEWYKFLSEKKPTASLDEYEWLQGMFSELRRQYEASLVTEREGVQAMGQPTTETWGAFLREFPHEQEWARQAPFSPYPEWYKFLGKQEAQVSPPKYRYMESIFPELTKKFEASLIKTAGGVQTKERPTPETWSKFLQKYPYGKEFSGLSSYERGFRGQYQPPIRTVNY